jgi:pyruvate kinase
LPNTDLTNFRSISEKDKNDVEFIMKNMNDIDYFALSFVKNKDDIMDLRELLKKYEKESEIIKHYVCNGENCTYSINSLPRIIAKIERPECFNEFIPKNISEKEIQKNNNDDEINKHLFEENSSDQLFEILKISDGVWIARGDVFI